MCKIYAFLICVDIIKQLVSPNAVMLSQIMWHESAGIQSDMEKVGVAWCVLNRVDDERFPNTIKGVLEQPLQFDGYSSSNPVEPSLYFLSLDVVRNWEKEKKGMKSNRTLPIEYLYYYGNGEHNFYRKEYRDREYWGWEIPDPYKE